MVETGAASLVEAIRAHVSSARIAPGLGDRLVSLVENARTARPRVALAGETFVSHVGTHWGGAPDLSAAIDALAAGDLYLACACAEGDAAALAILDGEELPKVAGYIARVHRSPDFVSEVLQTLRVKLLVPRDGRRPAIADYTGKGSLHAWLRVAAVRVARTLVKGHGRYATLQTNDAEDPPKAAPRAADPEVELLKGEGAEMLDRALATALDGVSDADRTLLRLYFVEGMALSALGRIYHVHESTMQRRIHALRERLLEAMKSELAASSSNLLSRLALVESRLDIHLSQHLRPKAP